MRNVLILLGLMIFMIASVACNEASEVAETTEPAAEQPATTTEAENPDVNVITTESGLQYIDQVVGDGEDAVTGVVPPFSQADLERVMRLRL